MQPKTLTKLLALLLFASEGILWIVAISAASGTTLYTKSLWIFGALIAQSFGVWLLVPWVKGRKGKSLINTYHED